MRSDISAYLTGRYRGTAVCKSLAATAQYLLDRMGGSVPVDPVHVANELDIQVRYVKRSMAAEGLALRLGTTAVDVRLNVRGKGDPRPGQDGCEQQQGGERASS